MSIIQDWAACLGLRHQGVLLTAVRGADISQKDGADKTLVRFYRAHLLRAHVGDPAKSVSFIQLPKSGDEFWAVANTVAKSHDHLPHHYIMHLVHAAEITGYYHSDGLVRGWWRDWYFLMCHKFHMSPETKAELDLRLGLDEESFRREQEVQGTDCDPVGRGE